MQVLMFRKFSNPNIEISLRVWKSWWGYFHFSAHHGGLAHGNRLVFKIFVLNKQARLLNTK